MEGKVYVGRIKLILGEIIANEGGREGGRERRERNVNERGFNPISHVIFMASNFVRKV